jgi:hypothetical protein
MKFSSLTPSRKKKPFQSLLWSIKQQKVLYKQTGDVVNTLRLSRDRAAGRRRRDKSRYLYISQQNITVLPRVA